MDDSIGCAIWFAARGIGKRLGDPEPSPPYVSPAKVSLSCEDSSALRSSGVGRRVAVGTCDGADGTLLLWAAWGRV